MKRQISVAFLIVAWVCAQGAVWDVAQAVAWGKMFAGYVQTETVGDSLRLTFDQQKPCEWCHFVQEARNAEKDSGEENEPGRDTGRLILALPHKEMWHPDPPRFFVLYELGWRPGGFSAEGRTPPPRRV